MDRRRRFRKSFRNLPSGESSTISIGMDLVRHKLWNTGSDVLRLLCWCAPGYEHEDTVITDGE